uniref:Acidic mammalian chitinase n=1 Tax=Lygus hesperus TaxID=30085 RepID=A0A146LM60_LYGHE
MKLKFRDEGKLLSFQAETVDVHFLKRQWVTCGSSFVYIFIIGTILTILAFGLFLNIFNCQSRSTSPLVTNGISGENQNYRVVCYYVIPSNNSRTRPLPPDAVDPYFCSHIIIGFAGVQNGTIQPQQDSYLEIYKKIIAYKKFNPSLKVMLSVEDMSAYGEFSRVVSSQMYRTKFIVNTVKFLTETGFDGLDLDWEFPSWPDGDLIQVSNYSLLISELRNYVNKEAKHLLLSAAVAAPDLIIQQSYEVGELAKYLDFVNIMCYDYHMYSQFIPVTGPNAPLYPRPQEQGYFRTLNTDWSATQWVNLGMPPGKINVGIPTYGHSFRLLNEDNNGWNAPASGFGEIGDGGFITYPDACGFIQIPKTTHYFDDTCQVPYAFNGPEWISYENTLSVSLKAYYIKDRHFGGAMIYSLNTDDFYGECGDQKFPLTREVNYVLTQHVKEFH